MLEQVILVGGTGQTGRRLLRRLCAIPGLRVVATSRMVASGLPADAQLPALVLSEARAFGDRILWRPLELDSSREELKAQLDVITSDVDRGLKTALVMGAAYTDVEACEKDPERCQRINVDHTKTVIEWADVQFGAKPLFYSTDYVFDGREGPYAETAARHPLSVYGRAKAGVEEWLEKKYAGSLIIRTTGIFDWLPGSMNFLMQVEAAARSRKPRKLPSDQFANPTWADDLALATVELLRMHCAGIFHVAGGTYLSRPEFAALICEVFNLDAERLFTQADTRSLGQAAARPLKAGLKTDKVMRELRWSPRTAQAALEILKAER